MWAAAEAPRARRAVLRWATAEASVEERPRLIALLDDPSLEVRRWAIEGLARVGEPADVDLLLPALETTRDDVDLAAAVAVLAIDARTEPASPGP